MEKMGYGKKHFLLLSLIGFLLFTSLGVTYSYFVFRKNQDSNNFATSSCFRVTFTDKNDISLEYASPINDSDSSKLVPYEFTIKNVCNNPTQYNVNIEKLNVSTLNDSFLKYRLDDDQPLILGNQSLNESILNEDATTSRTIKTGSLLPNEEVTYDLRLWIDVDSTIEAANKIYESKVVVNTTLAGDSYKRITFDNNGGFGDEDYRYVENGKAIGTLPKPKKSYKKFAGWFINDVEVDDSYVVSDNITLQARWDDLTRVKVIFDAVGVEVNPSEVELDINQAIGSLPTPSKIGYTFINWKDSRGNVVDSNTSFNEFEEEVLTAQYEAYSYGVTINVGDHLTTSANLINVDYASSNTVVITADDGYYISSGTCTNGYTTNIVGNGDFDGAQTVTINNNSTLDSSTCTFSATIKSINYVSSEGSDLEGSGSRNKPYSTLNKAYDELPNGGTIKLLSDIDVSEQVLFDEDKAITLTSDSNTYNITRSNELVDGGTIRITNNVLTYENVNLSSSENNFSNIHISEDAKLIVNSGSISTTSEIANVILNYGELVINGGTFTSTSTNPAIANSVDSSFTMTDGVISTTNVGIQNREGNISSISGGSISSTSANCITNIGSLTISGTVNFSGGYSSDGNASAAISNMSAGTLEVNGGNFNPVGFAVNNGGSATIKGGTLTSTNSNVIRNSGTLTIQDNAVISGNNLFYTILSDSGTLTIAGGDITGSSSVVVFIGENCTVNVLDGVNLSASNASTIVFANNGSLTIGNGTIEHTSGTAVYNLNTGTLYLNDTNISSGRYAVYNMGTANVDGGSYILTGDNYNVLVNRGIMNITGNPTIHDVVNADSYPIITNSNGGELTIESATISAVSTRTVINNHSNSTININGGTYSGDGTIFSNNGTFNVNSNIVINATSTSKIPVVNSSSGTFTFNAGTISSTGSNVVSNAGTMYVKNDTSISGSSGTSSLWNKTGGILNISGGTISATSANPISNSGTTNISGTATIRNASSSNASANIYNNTNGVLTIESGTISSLSGNSLIYNVSSGTVNINGGTYSGGGTFIYNKGTFNVNSNVSFTGATSGKVAVYNSNSGTLTFNSGSVSSNASNTISNEGTIYIKNDTSISGTANFATIWNKNTGTLNISDGTVSTNTSNAILNYGSINMNGGSIIGTTSGKPIVYTYADSTCDISGGTISAGSSNAINNSGTLTVSGTADISNSSAASGTIYNSSNGSVTVSGGTVTNSDSSGYALYNSGGTFNVTGGIITGRRNF